MQVFAAETDATICETNNGYNLYECRVEKICEIEKYTVTPPVKNNEDYKSVEAYLKLSWGNSGPSKSYEVFDIVKAEYRKNIGDIYKCSMIQVQKKSLRTIEEMIKEEKTGTLADVISNRIQLRESKLDAAAKSIECKIGKTDEDSIYNKDDVLKQATQEACTYVTYLEYLEDHYSSIPNIIWVDETNNEDKDNDWEADVLWVIQEYSTTEIVALISSIQQEIAFEKEHTYKVFPIAYQAYTEYENNYPLHFMLEVIREDFVILRKALYQTLMPIAQVWYKIINAMIK